MLLVSAFKKLLFNEYYVPCVVIPTFLIWSQSNALQRLRSTSLKGCLLSRKRTHFGNKSVKNDAIIATCSLFVWRKCHTKLVVSRWIKRETPLWIRCMETSEVLLIIFCFRACITWRLGLNSRLKAMSHYT